MKNLPHLPQVPRSKLGRKRSSFGMRGRLAILNLPRICRTCRICPRLDRFRDEPLEKRATTGEESYGVCCHFGSGHAGWIALCVQKFFHGV